MYINTYEMVYEYDTICDNIMLPDFQLPCVTILLYNPHLHFSLPTRTCAQRGEIRMFIEALIVWPKGKILNVH